MKKERDNKKKSSYLLNVSFGLVMIYSIIQGMVIILSLMTDNYLGATGGFVVGLSAIYLPFTFCLDNSERIFTEREYKMSIGAQVLAYSLFSSLFTTTNYFLVITILNILLLKYYYENERTRTLSLTSPMSNKEANSLTFKNMKSGVLRILLVVQSFIYVRFIVMGIQLDLIFGSIGAILLAFSIIFLWVMDAKKPEEKSFSIGELILISSATIGPIMFITPFEGGLEPIILFILCHSFLQIIIILIERSGETSHTSITLESARELSKLDSTNELLSKAERVWGELDKDALNYKESVSEIDSLLKEELMRLEISDLTEKQRIMSEKAKANEELLEELLRAD